MRLVKKFAWFFTLAYFTAPTSLFACAACFGKSDSAMAKSLNAGIFSLMGVIVTVLFGAASFFVFLARKAAAASAPAPAADFPISHNDE